MAKNKEHQPPRLSRAERRKLEEEKRIKLHRWVEEKQHNEIFQQTLREFSRRRGSKVEYDPTDKDSVWKVLQSQPDYDLIYDDSGAKHAWLFSRYYAQRLIIVISGIVIVILLSLFYLAIKEPVERKFPGKPTMIYRVR